MDIVSISSSISSVELVSTDVNEEPSHTSVNSGSTGDTVSDSGEGSVCIVEGHLHCHICWVFFNWSVVSKSLVFAN